MHKSNVSQPEAAEIISITHKISIQVSRYLERAGFIEQDAENTWLSAGVFSENVMEEHQSHSVSYRIAIGPQKGRKVFSLQTLLPPHFSEQQQDELVGKIAGFSLHAGVSIKANQREKLERLCRYISRPAIATHRLSLTTQGKIRYELKTPYSNGTTHIIFEPLDFISKLAALVPPPKVNLTRFFGVFAPNSKHRNELINRKKEKNFGTTETGTESERRRAMNWAHKLKRAFKIDIDICEICKGYVRIIACVEDSIVIKKILDHLNSKVGKGNNQLMLPILRAPPGIK